jgi:hypothetical protein
MKKGALISVLLAFAAASLSSPTGFCDSEVKRYEVPSAFPEDLPGTALSVYLPDG